MSKKRARKKQLKQRQEVRDRAENLYLRGEDDAFLELVVEVEDLDAAGLAQAYREVVDRTLRRVLGKADLGALEKLLKRPRAGVEKLPSACLAAAVVDLDAGRLDRARSRLEALASSAGEGAVPDDLVASLRSLCDAAPGTAAGGTPVDDYLKLRRTLDRYAAGEIEKLPGNLRLAAPRAKETLDFLRSLETVGRATRPTAQALGRLRRTARALLEGSGPGRESEILALGAIRFARWLATAGELEAGLNRSGAGAEDVERALGSFHGDADKLRELFDERMPAALHGLRHLLETRCRAIFARLEVLGGPESLARVLASVGGSFDSMLEIAGPGAGPPGTGAEARARLGNWAAARLLLDHLSFPELARLCHRESADEGDPRRLAMLWAVELNALWQAAEVDEDDFEDPFVEDFDEDDEPKKEAWRQLAGRLRAISAQLARRLPAPEQRVQVARVLRRQLLDLAAASNLSEPHLAAAENLLGILDGDAALLLAALAAATEVRDRSAARRLGDRVAARGPAPASDLDSLMPFLSPPPGKDADDIVAFLRRARPLFGEDWPRARATAAQVVEVRVVFLLGAVLQATGGEDRDLVAYARRTAREELDGLRPVLGEEHGFAVAELLAESAFEDESKIRSSVRDFLRRRSDLEAALAALRALDALNEAAYGFERSRALAIEATLSRLDHRCSLWYQAFMAVFPTLERKQLLLAYNRIEKVLSGDAFDRSDRQRIEEVQSMIGEVLDLFHRRPRRKTTRSRRGKKRRRSPKRPPRQPAAASGQLELFGPAEEGSP